MSTHTPGPWYVYGTKQDQIADLERGLPVLVCAKQEDDDESSDIASCHNIDAGDMVAIANAALIAAAPELKDLLFHALHYIETPGDFTERERLELCQDIDNIIAKAEGRG